MKPKSDAVLDEGEIIPDTVVDDVIIFGCDVYQWDHPDNAVFIVIAFQNDVIIARQIVIDQLVRGEYFAQYDEGKMILVFGLQGDIELGERDGFNIMEFKVCTRCDLDVTPNQSDLVPFLCPHK